MVVIEIAVIFQGGFVHDRFWTRAELPGMAVFINGRGE